MRFRNIVEFQRWHGVAISKTAFNVAFYGLLLAAVVIVYITGS
jgi:hypothetical protein